MRPRGRGKHGDHLVQDDRTGFTEWASDCVKEWNGALVHRRHYEARHPQDFIRARRDTSSQIRDARPELSLANTNFRGVLTTTIATPAAGDNEQMAPMGALGEFALGQNSETDFAHNAAGSTMITVESTSSMSAFDRLGILLSSGDLFMTHIFSIPSPTTLILTEPLPGAAAVGNLITDYSVTT